MEEPWILLSSGGNQQTFDDCSALDLAKNWTGDGDISWDFEFNPLTDQAPPAFALVEAHDDLGLIQTARIASFDLPDTKECAGTVTYRAEGLWASLTDRKHAGTRRYGFRFNEDPDPVIATTADAAVVDAITQLAGAYILGYTVPSSTFELSDTEDFIGRSTQDVIGSMNTVGGGLATPLVAQVRNGYFTWEALDLAARYQVSCDVAKVKPHYDATKIYNRVIVIWGKGQAVTYPDTVVYDQLPSAVDLVVNASTEVFTVAAATRLAEGLYQRVQNLEYGWSCTVTIPWSGGGVDELGIGLISPARVRTARMIRLVGLDAVSRWGANAARFTDLQLIKSARWNGKAHELTLECGEVRSQTDTVRFQTLSQSSRMIWTYQTPGLSTPTPSNDKLLKFGPELTTDSIAGGVPSPVGYGVTAFNKETNQQLPTHSFPAPIKIEKGGSNGAAAFTAGLLDQAEYRSEIPPCVITSWILTGSPSGSISIRVSLAKKDTDGSYLLTAGLMTEDRIILTATLTSGSFATHTFSGTVGPDQVVRIPEDAILLYRVTENATNTTKFTLTLNGNRIVPGFPEGLDTVPSVSTRSA